MHDAEGAPKVEGVVSHIREDQTFQFAPVLDEVPVALQHEINNGDDSSHQAHDTLLDTQPHLPSEVPETLQLNDGDHVHNERPRPADVEECGIRINAPTNVAESTQPISQSFYTTLIKKSKSLSLPEDADESAETQKTLEEGDQGHVDIMSSFVTGQAGEAEAEAGAEGSDGSEILDFSPTQSQHNLTQYPESERFKTPATAGRKRNYRGQYVDSPYASRNPLRDGMPTPGNAVGLSQVFAGTQAASSPFSNGLTTGPSSDRPSPNVELQARPASAMDSSPLREISVFKSAVTEPATRYVSLKQSQAERNRETGSGSDDNGTVDEDDDFDAFNDASSYVEREKRRVEREKRLVHKLYRLTNALPSSPRAKDLEAKFAALKEQAAISEELSTLDKEQTTGLNEPESEAETEQEDNVVVRTQQPSVDNDENKENQEVDVPRTVTSKRLHNFINGSVAEIDASPSTKQSVQPSQAVVMNSSAFQDVPNSQPGDERRRNVETVTTAKDRADPQAEADLSSEVVADVRYGQHAEPLHSPKDACCTQPSRPEAIEKPHEIDSDRHDLPTSSSNLTRSSVVAETESDLKRGRSDSARIANENSTETTTTHQFETAHTHHVPQDDMSSQPVSKTPPGKRRRRLIDISAEPSPLKSTPSFNFQQALELDQDHEIARELLISPSAIRNDDVLGPSPKPAISDRAANQGHPGHAEHTHETEQEDHAGGTNKSLHHRWLGRAKLAPPITSPVAPDRASIWDVGDSPQKPSPKANERKKIPLTTKCISRLEERLRPQPVEDASMSAPARIRRTSPRVDTHPNPQGQDYDKEIIAPNRVFACFNGKIRAYYPAICLGLAGNETCKYRIQWEGYEPDEVDVHGVAGLDLRLGDAIKVNLQGFPKIPYIVHGFKDKVEKGSPDVTDVRGYATLIVASKQRKSLPSKPEESSLFEVPIRAIYLDNNMWVQIKNRPFDFRVDDAPEVSEGIATPRERPGTPNTPSSRRRPQLLPTNSSIRVENDGLFANMAFAVSYDDIERKNSLVGLIQQQGGLILANSFDEMLITEKTANLALQDQFAHLGFTALLTEAYSRKEKYMQALALGLPCLSGTWIEACARRKTLVDWQTFLLPAGECTELDGAARSRILAPSEASGRKLVDILHQRPRLLQGTSAIVVTGRGKAEMRWAKYVFLIRAMGCERIVEVADLKGAQPVLEADSTFNWLFVDDKDVASTHQLLHEKPMSSKRSKAKAIVNHRDCTCTVAGQELIVQSLILGQLSLGDESR